MYTLAIPILGHPGWQDHWGDLYLTRRAEKAVERGADIDSCIRRIIAGDYGMLSEYPEDHANIQAARESGWRFTAAYKLPEGELYFSVGERGRTICCKLDER